MDERIARERKNGPAPTSSGRSALARKTFYVPRVALGNARYTRSVKKDPLDPRRRIRAVRATKLSTGTNKSTRKRVARSNILRSRRISNSRQRKTYDRVYRVSWTWCIERDVMSRLGARIWNKVCSHEALFSRKSILNIRQDARKCTWLCIAIELHCRSLSRLKFMLIKTANVKNIFPVLET